MYPVRDSKKGQQLNCCPFAFILIYCARLMFTCKPARVFTTGGGVAI